MAALASSMDDPALVSFVNWLSRLGAEGAGSAAEDHDGFLGDGCVLLRAAESLHRYCRDDDVQNVRAEKAEIEPEMAAMEMNSKQRLALVRARVSALARLLLDAEQGDELSTVLGGSGMLEISVLDIAKILLICAVRSSAKDEVVPAIMAMKPKFQQQLMMHIRSGCDEILERYSAAGSGSRRMSLEMTMNRSADVEMLSSEVERLRLLLEVAEREARDSNRAAEAAKAQAHAERSTKVAEIERFRAELSAACDERDVAKHKARQLGVLQNTVKRYETKMDQFDHLQSQLSDARQTIKTLQDTIVDLQSDTSVESLQDQVNKSKRDFEEQDVVLHGVKTERNALSIEVKQLSSQIVSLESENRHLQEHIDSLEAHASSLQNMPNSRLEAPKSLIESIAAADTKTDPTMISKGTQCSENRARLVDLQEKLDAKAASYEHLCRQFTSLETSNEHLNRRAERAEKRIKSLLEMTTVEEMNVKRVCDERDVAVRDLQDLQKIADGLRRTIEKNKQQQQQKTHQAEGSYSIKSESRENDHLSVAPPASGLDPLQMSTLSARIGPAQQVELERARLANITSSFELREELKLMSSALHGVAQEFQRRCLKGGGQGHVQSRSLTRPYSRR